MEKSLDSQVLAALLLMSKDKILGVGEIELVKQNIKNEVLDLVDKGYAVKIKIREDYANYRLTELGGEFLNKIIKYTSEQF